VAAVPAAPAIRAELCNQRSRSATPDSNVSGRWASESRSIVPRAFRRGRDGVAARSLRRPRRAIEFLCPLEDKGVIAEPVPARTVQPAWFKRLPGLDRAELSATNNGLTVKRCVPFLDAMGTGSIVPLAATVRLEVGDGGTTVTAGWEFDRELVSTHSAHQAAGNPFEPRPLMKFHNPWTIRTPSRLELPVRRAAEPAQRRVSRS